MFFFFVVEEKLCVVDSDLEFERLGEECVGLVLGCSLVLDGGGFLCFFEVECVWEWCSLERGKELVDSGGDGLFSLWSLEKECGEGWWKDEGCKEVSEGKEFSLVLLVV